MRNSSTMNRTLVRAGICLIAAAMAANAWAGVFTTAPDTEAQLDPQPPVRTRSLRITNAVDVDGAPPARIVSHRRESGGNIQIQNVEATGGPITQRQSGSGNVQSMNIGVTDSWPVRPASVNRQ